MASTRAQVTRPLNCPGCGRDGAAVWEEEAAHTPGGLKGKRRLMRLEGRFHTEEGRTQSGECLIVCDACDAFQPA